MALVDKITGIWQNPRPTAEIGNSEQETGLVKSTKLRNGTSYKLDHIRKHSYKRLKHRKNGRHYRRFF